MNLVIQSAARIIQRRTRARGFTLLEVMLAMSLSTVLLAVLWQAMNLHLRAFDAGRTEVEQAQLARVLLGQMERDLRGVIGAPASAISPTLPPAPPGMSPSGSPLAPPGSVPPAAPAPLVIGPFRQVEPRRDVGPLPARTEAVVPTQTLPSGPPRLVGRRRSLSLIVHHQQSQPELVPATSTAEGPRNPGRRRVVEYGWSQWTDPTDGLQPGGQAIGSQGLVRRQRASLPGTSRMPVAGVPEAAMPNDLGAATPPVDAPPSTDGGMLPPASGGAGGFNSQTTTTASGQMSIDASGLPTSEMRVAEIIDVAFRYFDGRMWQDNWDGGPENKLPTAVEITLALPRTERRRSPGDTSAENPPLSADPAVRPLDAWADARALAGDTQQAEVDQPFLVFRQIVRLPQGTVSRPAESGAPAITPMISRSEVWP